MGQVHHGSIRFGPLLAKARAAVNEAAAALLVELRDAAGSAILDIASRQQTIYKACKAE